MMWDPSVTSFHWTEGMSVRRSKRIAFGEPIPSLDTYKLYYFVQLRYSWACTSDQTNHEDSLFRCQEDYHKCGGTLIHPEFVLTAAHCVMYYEVIVYQKGNGTDDWVRDTADLIYYSLVEAWDKLAHSVVGYFIQTKPRHVVYSDWSLLMGSHDWYKMKQKRHVMKVFPHRIFPGNIHGSYHDRYFDLTQNSWHDIALLRACEPFKLKSGEVELAPMLKTRDALRAQYEHIVTQGTVCLYVGFGLQDGDQSAGYPQYEENLMLHTWRSSICNAACNKDVLATQASQHTCVLCSHQHGDKLGVPNKGDSGGPVTCEGRFVSTLTKALFVRRKNLTRADSYPLHCIIDSVSEARLAYYKTVPHGERYHPLNGTRRKRLPPPSE